MKLPVLFLRLAALSFMIPLTFISCNDPGIITCPPDDDPNYIAENHVYILGRQSQLDSFLGWTENKYNNIDFTENHVIYARGTASNNIHSIYYMMEYDPVINTCNIKIRVRTGDATVVERWEFLLPVKPIMSSSHLISDIEIANTPHPEGYIHYSGIEE